MAVPGRNPCHTPETPAPPAPPSGDAVPGMPIPPALSTPPTTAPIPPASPEPPTIAPIPPAQPGRPSDREEEAEVEVEQKYEVEGREEEKKPFNPEQEREAILKMIAEGRITPEEGDMLLEALEANSIPRSIDPMC
jgi:SHOCT-like protein